MNPEVVREFVMKYVAREQAAAALAQAENELKDSQEILLGEMQDNCLQDMSVQVPGLSRALKIERKIDHKPSIVNHEEFAQWAIDNGLREKLTMAVEMPDYETAVQTAMQYQTQLKCGMHFQTLKSQVTRWVEEKMEVPPGISDFVIEVLKIKER